MTNESHTSLPENGIDLTEYCRALSGSAPSPLEVDEIARMIGTCPHLGKPEDLARSIIARIDTMRRGLK